MTFRQSPCERHRIALFDFVDRREIMPSTTAALDHLERCDRCERELAGIAMALTGLRRIRAQIADAEPAPDAWPRLAARISEPTRQAWRWPATVRGLIVSTMLVAVAVASFVPAGLDGPPDRGMAPADVRVEQAYFLGARHRLVPDESSDAIYAQFPRSFPDGQRRLWKEVNPSRNGTQRPSTAT